MASSCGIGGASGPRRRAGAPILLGLVLACAGPVNAQELQAEVGYAHVFRAGGVSLAAGYLQAVGPAASLFQQRVGGDLWYANTDVASLPAGNTSRSLVGLGARYEIELARCCGRVHPSIALPVRLLHSAVSTPSTADLVSRAALEAVPRPPLQPPAEDQRGSAWGWGAGVELGIRVAVGPQWDLQTSGAAMYQDVYAESTTNGAWTWHVGLAYRFGRREPTDAAMVP